MDNLGSIYAICAGTKMVELEFLLLGQIKDESIRIYQNSKIMSKISKSLVKLTFCNAVKPLNTVT